MPRLLAVDSGLTVTKAVIFDLSGRQVAVARRNLAQLMPGPRMVERDMDAMWAGTASAIAEVMAASGTDPKDIIAVAATAHGDGVYLLDRANAPLGHGVLSLDSRAGDVVAAWKSDGVAAAALPITGQFPHASAPSALLAWIRDHQPDRFARIGTAFAAKDWLRFCLTGTIGTDRTEASTSFADVHTQRHSDDALALFGLSDLRPALPPVSASDAIVGHVTEDAGRLSGLRAGTPVAAGLHDVTASALGIGAHRAGVVGIVAGTYSINQCVAAVPRMHADWFCRAAIAPGLYNHMAISPASTANYDWFLENLGTDNRGDRSIHTALAPEISAGLSRPSSILYHPYLFGAPMGTVPSAGFLGLRGWHDRGDMLAALLEGIVFNHRQHVDALRAPFAAETARLTGGASRNPVVAQLFADVLGMPVTVTDTEEPAAWGAALCAGAAVGAFAGFDADPRDLEAISTTFTPDPARQTHYQARFETYLSVSRDLATIWPQLKSLGQMERPPLHD